MLLYQTDNSIQKTRIPFFQSTYTILNLAHNVKVALSFLVNQYPKVSYIY